MSHKTEVIKMQQVSDEALAVTIRCCGNKLTDSVLTLYDMSAEQLAQDIDKHHDLTAKKHAGMESGKALLGTTIQKTKVHEAV